MRCIEGSESARGRRCTVPPTGSLPADRRRHWVRNVVARSGIELRTGGETFHGEAEPVAGAEETTRVIELLKRKYWLARPGLWLKGTPSGVFRARAPG